MKVESSDSRTSRREILARCSAFALVGLGFIPPQNKRPGFPDPPAPGDPSNQDKNEQQGIDPQTAKRVMAAKNEKEFREGVEKLYQMATELRDELAQAPKMNVLSVRMYKKTDEIEKLAKQLKSKAKGG